MVFLKGVRVEEMREIVEEAVDSAFKPHVYRDALDLVARHRERGERSFIVSAALQEIVDALVSELGFDGGIGSTAEVEDGVYTGRLARRLDGPAKAARSWSSPPRRASTSGSRPRTPTLRATCRSSRPSAMRLQ